LDLRLKLANQGDVFLVAFSGHGLQLDGKSYLCPADARLDDASSLISIEELYAQLAKCKAAQKLVILDACRNDPIVKGFRSGKLADDLTIQLQDPPRGVNALFSCEPGQFSAEDANLKHGVFMHYVLEGLRGRADDPAGEGDGNGRIALDELFRYVHLYTKRHVANSHGVAQIPTWKNDNASWFDLAPVPDAKKRKELEGPSLVSVSPTKPVVVEKPAVLAKPAEVERLDNSLLKLGHNYLAQADHENAIRAYTAIIDDTSLDNEVRREARKSRGSAYIARGEKADLDKALIDQQAAGLPGIQLTIRTPANVMGYPDKVLGTIRQNQSVLVTKIVDGHWLWVASVDGSDAVKGYVATSAVVAQPVVAVTTVSGPASQNFNQQNFNQQNFNQRGSGPKSIWQTPKWESLREIRDGRRNGTLK
jgi:hypothetical protein